MTSSFIPLMEENSWTHAVDFHRRHSGARQRRENDTAQGIPQSMTVAGVKAVNLIRAGKFFLRNNLRLGR